MMNIRTTSLNWRGIICILLTLSMLFCMTACRAEVITMSPDQFLDRLNSLCADDFGAVTKTETIDAVTSLCQITERISLTLISDSVTGLLQRAELVLTFDPDMTDLDYSSFSYFFLVMLKAYDEKTSISNINAVYDALGISNYEPGIQTKIGYGSNTYFYNVTDTEARFSALYIQPAETLDF